MTASREIGASGHGADEPAGAMTTRRPRRYRPADGTGRDRIPGADPTTPPPPRFSVAVAHGLGTAVVTLRGVLDHWGAEQLQEVLADLIDRQDQLRRVVVDARDVRGIDPSIRPVFSAAAGQAAPRGLVFQLYGFSEPLGRAIQAVELPVHQGPST